MSAAGKVCTGFSLPYVALYSCSSGTVTYSSGQKLARGVDVSIEPETSDDSDFYADNVLAESSGRKFIRGTVTLTVDGLLMAAERLIMGLPTGSGDWVPYDDNQDVPYVGIGFIARYMSDGAESFVPYILTKCQFDEISSAAATQGEDIDWQTQTLTAKIYRDGSADHVWKKVGKSELATEAAAEVLIKTAFSIT